VVLSQCWRCGATKPRLAARPFCASCDPDVSTAQLVKALWLPTVLLAVGAALTFTFSAAPLGIPILLFGLVVHRERRRSLALPRTAG
jgi:hypothetical protein